MRERDCAIKLPKRENFSSKMNEKSIRWTSVGKCESFDSLVLHVANVIVSKLIDYFWDLTVVALKQLLFFERGILKMIVNALKTVQRSRLEPLALQIARVLSGYFWFWLIWCENNDVCNYKVFWRVCEENAKTLELTAFTQSTCCVKIASQSNLKIFASKKFRQLSRYFFIKRLGPG